MIGKHFTETSNKVVLRINRVRINRVQPVYISLLYYIMTLGYFTVSLMHMKTRDNTLYLPRAREVGG